MSKARTQPRTPAVAADAGAKAPVAEAPKVEAPAAAAPKPAEAKAPRPAPEPAAAAAGTSMHETHAQTVFVDQSFHEEFPEDWSPPAQLEAPPPREGMTQRWVRMTILGQNDGTNIANQSGQGWRPRRLDTVPDAEQSRYPSAKSARFGEVIISGALILCEMPVAVYAKMEKYYKDKRIGLIETIRNDQALRSAVKAPKAGGGFGEVEAIERSTQVTTRRPIVAAD